MEMAPGYPPSASMHFPGCHTPDMFSSLGSPTSEYYDYTTLGGLREYGTPARPQQKSKVDQYAQVQKTCMKASKEDLAHKNVREYIEKQTSYEMECERRDRLDEAKKKGISCAVKDSDDSSERESGYDSDERPHPAPKSFIKLRNRHNFHQKSAKDTATLAVKEALTKEAESIAAMRDANGLLVDTGGKVDYVALAKQAAQLSRQSEEQYSYDSSDSCDSDDEIPYPTPNHPNHTIKPANRPKIRTPPSDLAYPHTRRQPPHNPGPRTGALIAPQPACSRSSAEARAYLEDAKSIITLDYGKCCRNTGSSCYINTGSTITGSNNTATGSYDSTPLTWAQISQERLARRNMERLEAIVEETEQEVAMQVPSMPLSPSKTVEDRQKSYFVGKHMRMLRRVVKKNKGVTVANDCGSTSDGDGACGGSESSSSGSGSGSGVGDTGAKDEVGVVEDADEEDGTYKGVIWQGHRWALENGSWVKQVHSKTTEKAGGDKAGKGKAGKGKDKAGEFDESQPTFLTIDADGTLVRKRFMPDGDWDSDSDSD